MILPFYFETQELLNTIYITPNQFFKLMKSLQPVFDLIIIGQITQYNPEYEKNFEEIKENATKSLKALQMPEFKKIENELLNNINRLNGGGKTKPKIVAVKEAGFSMKNVLVGVLGFMALGGSYMIEEGLNQTEMLKLRNVGIKQTKKASNYIINQCTLSIAPQTQSPSGSMFLTAAWQWTTNKLAEVSGITNLYSEAKKKEFSTTLGTTLSGDPETWRRQACEVVTNPIFTGHQLVLDNQIERWQAVNPITTIGNLSQAIGCTLNSTGYCSLVVTKIPPSIRNVLGSVRIGDPASTGFFKAITGYRTVSKFITSPDFAAYFSSINDFDKILGRATKAAIDRTKAQSANADKFTENTKFAFNYAFTVIEVLGLFFGWGAVLKGINFVKLLKGAASGIAPEKLLQMIAPQMVEEKRKLTLATEAKTVAEIEEQLITEYKKTADKCNLTLAKLRRKFALAGISEYNNKDLQEILNEIKEDCPKQVKKTAESTKAQNSAAGTGLKPQRGVAVTAALEGTSNAEGGRRRTRRMRHKNKKNKTRGRK
jgi:gas vesicle protein